MKPVYFLILFFSLSAGGLYCRDINEASDYRPILARNGFSDKNINEITLNTYGYRLYLKKQYSDAVQLFRNSINLNSFYIVPYYNLACTLSLQYENKEQADLNELFYSLKMSLHLNPQRMLRNIQTDSDLKSIRNLREYSELLKNFDQNSFIITNDSLYLSENGGQTFLAKLYKTDLGPVQIENYFSYSFDQFYIVIAGVENGKPCLFVASKPGIITKINGADNIYSSPPYGPDIAWFPGTYKFVFCNDNSIYSYSITNNELKRLTFSETKIDIQPSIDKKGKIHFMRGGIVEFSFSGTEYIMNPDGSVLEKVQGGKNKNGENLRGGD